MADTSKRISGTAYFSVNGVSYSMRGQIGYSAAINEKTTIIDAGAAQYYEEKPVQGAIWGDFTDVPGLKMADFNNMTNEAITLELANGKTVIGTGMRQVGKLDVNVDNATASVRWEGEVTEA